MLKPFHLWNAWEVGGPKYPSVLFFHGAVAAGACFSSAVGSLSPLQQEGRWKSSQKLGVTLCVPGWPKSPLSLCDCHTACVGTGGSFSTWCDIWQEGTGNHTVLSSAPSVPYLHFWELGFQIKCWKQMFSMWDCVPPVLMWGDWLGLSVVVT